MSNTLTNVKDIKVAQKALMPFMAQLLPVTAFSIDFSPLPADKLDTVRVPLVGAPSTSSDFAGDYTANADSTVTVAPVVLNRHKFKTVHVTARENAEVSLNTLETLVEAAAQQLAQDVLVDILSVVTAATYGTPGIPAFSATAFDYKKVLGIREVCGNAKMPPNPRSLVLDSGYYTNLLADDVVAKSFNLNLNAPAVTEGTFKAPITSTVVTATSASAQTVVNFVPYAGAAANDVVVLFSSITGTGVRGVVSSVQAGVSITLTANLGLALAPGDMVHLMTARAQIPVGAATKEANAPTVFVVLEGPALIELDGTTACHVNLVAGEYS